MFKQAAIEKSFRKAFIILTLSELAAAIGPVIDGVIIAAFYGAAGVRQYGLVNPMIIAYSVLGSVFAVGSVTLCSRLVGEGKTKEARGGFSVAFIWVLALSVLITIVLLLLATPMTKLLGADPGAAEFFSETRNYYIGLTISFPATNLLLLLNAYMQVDNDTARTLVSTIVLTVVDIAGDLLSVLVFRGGMLGMGLATSLANYLALVVVLFHFAKKNAFFKPTFRNLPWRLTGQMLGSGLPAFAMLIGNTAAFIILNRILVWFDQAAALVAFTAMRSVFNIVSTVVKGLGRCVMTMAGFFFGERNKEEMMALFRLMVKYTIIAGGAAAILVFFAASPLASIFTGKDSASMLPEAALAVRCLAFYLPFMCFAAGYESFLRGAGQLKPSLIITVLRDFFLPVVCGFVLSRIWGARGIYGSLTASNILLTAGLLVLMFLLSRKAEKSLAARIFFFPASFDIPEEDYLSANISTIPECVAFSVQIEMLCSEHGLDKRKAVFSALCLEEMGRNVLEHGFEGKKKNLISAFAFIDKDQKIHLSIRDNCRPFSPMEWEKIHHDDEDRTSNIGIRMVSKLAEEMRYVNLMDMNSLYIRI
ncbi:MAG: ATP-binding protein [Parasporobacterium sp.]|nr:ATP-binding protein [Parasporobacterium sp.]